MSNNKVDGALCFFRHTQGNNKGELVSVAVNIEKEEDRKQFIPLFRRLLEYPEFVRAMEEEDAGNTKWYNCAHCDAGYPDQECTCEENEE